MERPQEKFEFRMAYEKDWEPAMKLAWETFLIFEASDYTDEGIESFRDFISDQWLKKMFLKGQYQMFVALDQDKIIGFLTIRNEHHISLLFVDKDYHYKGIGKTLVQKVGEYIITEIGVDYMTVDSAPYALEFYHKLGFWDLAPQQQKQGIIYTSMKKNLKYATLENNVNKNKNLF
ncbi:MAG: GNAT family N-acetyltransferase [Lachnospiraceae bacterium]|nr:GNAT family N-acetyltransferase [Lachnospiraceae bacterium]